MMLIACGQQNQKETNMEFTDNVKMALADSGRISLDSLQWTREPAGFEVKGDTIRITTAPKTDLWQRTYYHFQNDNAPVLQMKTREKFFSFVVKTDFTESHHRFDQCGIVMYLDSENWLKGSVEYENEEFQHLGSVATNNGIRFNVLCDYCTSSYYGSIADGHSSKNGGIGSNPYVLANVDGSIAHALTLGRVKVVVDGCQHDVVTYECTLVDGDTALILELTAHVDEDPFTNDGVLAAVGMKRRKHSYRLGYLTPPKLFQQIVQLLWSMILAVDLCCYLQSFLRQLMKHHVNFAAAHDGLA